MQSRYYNAEWGRFINADALIGQPGDILSFNMFAYCGNNPVIMGDPNGYRFDITGGRYNGKYISMAIQSQYPAIANNVANRKPIPQPKPNKNNEIIKSIKKDVTATAIDETLKELPKVGKVIEKLKPVGNYFKYKGIYENM